MEKILNILTNIILPIIIIILALFFAIFLYKKLQKKFNKPLDNTLTASDNPQVKLKNNYCTEAEMKFLSILHKTLPRECIAFPHVGVSKLIEPKGNMNDYKSIIDKYVDVCVFLRKEMKPILVIDLFQVSPIAQQLKKFDDNINKILNAIKIPVLHIQIQNNYNLDELLMQIYKKLDNITIAYLNSKTR